MLVGNSHLILPRVDEDALVEIGVDKRHVCIASLEILSIEARESTSLDVTVDAVVILVRRLWETFHLPVLAGERER